MSENEIERLCDGVRQCSHGLHQHLRYGHSKKMYESGLAHRLKRAHLEVVQEAPVPDEDTTILVDLNADPVV